VKAIILAGGSGTRLHPLTIGVSKQLLPVYNKPLIYYPLSTIMLAGIRQIAIVCKKEDLDGFKKLLGDGSQWGIELTFVIQDYPGGIAQGILLCEEFISGHRICLILGDNIFYGAGLGQTLERFHNLDGAQIFGYPVANPEDYGVVEVDEVGHAIKLVEKPSEFFSSLAIAGMYFYDNQVVDFAKKLKPSPRGELEITDLNVLYLQASKLKVEVLHRGTAWFDCGSFSSLLEASNFVRVLEDRQGLRIGDLSEIAHGKHWI
jgi:glucose-1-phosphate thymidylyltransferase